MRDEKHGAKPPAKLGRRLIDIFGDEYPVVLGVSLAIMIGLALLGLLLGVWACALSR